MSAHVDAAAPPELSDHDMATLTLKRVQDQWSKPGCFMPGRGVVQERGNPSSRPSRPGPVTLKQVANGIGISEASEKFAQVS